MKHPVWTVVFVLLTCVVSQRTANAETWQELLAKADSLIRIGQYDSTTDIEQKALQAAVTGPGATDTTVARLLNKLAAMHRNLGQNPRAVEVRRKALDIYRASVPASDFRYIACENDLGVALLNCQSFAAAESSYAAAIKDCETSPSCDKKMLGLFLEEAGESAHAQGHRRDAAMYWKQCLSTWEACLGRNDPKLARVLQGLSSAMADSLNTREQEALWRRIVFLLEHATDLPAMPTRSTAYDRLACFLQDEARYSEAEDMRWRALREADRACRADCTEIAVALNNLGYLLNTVGRYVEAEPLLRRGAAIYEHQTKPNPYYFSYLLLNLSASYTGQKRYVEADSTLRAADKVRGVEGDDALYLNNYASLYMAFGNHAAAESLEVRAIATEERQHGSKSGMLPWLVDGLVTTLIGDGRLRDADSLLAVSWALLDSGRSMDLNGVANHLQLKAILFRTRGDWRKAVDCEDKAFRLLRQSFRDNCDALSEQSALQYAQLFRNEASYLTSILLDVPQDSFKTNREIANLIFSTKGQVSDAFLVRTRNTTSQRDVATKTLSDSLQYARAALSRLYANGLGGDTTGTYRRMFDTAASEKARLETELSRASAAFRRDQKLWDIRANQMAAELPPTTALVEYLRYVHRVSVEGGEDRYVAVVQTSVGDPVVVPLGAAGRIDSAITRYRGQFVDAYIHDYIEYRDPARSLYDLVWKPVDSLCAGASMVFIAPDGELNRVSFASLMYEKDRFLIEKYPIHYLGTGRDLIRLKDNEDKAGVGLLAMGDPDYDATASQRAGKAPIANVDSLELSVGLNRSIPSGCPALKDLKVPRLPGTRQEVERISGFWKQSGQEAEAIYTRETATEDKLKAEAKGRRVIHLATHGFYIAEACRPKNVGRGYIGENPLLMSGLLLAGANLHGQGADSLGLDDGIVTAEEVAGLDLRGIQMVVLSACETGLGDIKAGEGVYGLRRAFQIAGARTVVSALWRVPDRVTADMMSKLYARGEKDIPTLMRRAMLDYLQTARTSKNRDLEHPFYWAGFVATGDWKMK